MEHYKRQILRDLTLPDELRGYREAIDVIGWNPIQQLEKTLGSVTTSHNIISNSQIVLFQALPALIIYLSMFSFLCRKYSRFHLTGIDPVIQGAFLFFVISLSMGPYFLLSGDWTRLVTSIAINSSLLILVFSTIDRKGFERTFFIDDRWAGALSFGFVTETSLRDKKYTFVVVLLMFWATSTFRISGSDPIKMNGDLAYQGWVFVQNVRASGVDAAMDLIGFFLFY